MHISVINLISKLITKVLANRLCSMLSELIDANQTAFVHGRYIVENFLTVLLKVDFSKAFDSVNWNFLSDVHARGFPIQWILWIQDLLSSLSSRVVVNDERTPFFNHKRGCDRVTRCLQYCLS
jgi:Reverse transcriptase (RNA-dependent DNA polymerase)